MTIMLAVLKSSGDEHSIAEFRKAVGAFARCQIGEGAWLIDTSLKLTIVFAELSGGLNPSDQLLLTRIENNWEYFGSGRAGEWLSSEKRRFESKDPQTVIGRIAKRLT